MSQRRVEVAVRVRPDDTQRPSCVVLNARRRVVTVSDELGAHSSLGSRSYREDLLLDADVSNKEVFRRLILDKMNAATPDTPDTLCFLAYGHTASGKTHSIAGSDAEPGILTLAVEELLRREGVVEVAMLEVYMDSVYDLLAEGAARRIRRRQGPTGMSIIVESLATCTLSTVAQWSAVSAYGMKSRRTAPTERNPRSSRSHAIFTLKSRGVRLCLVDLAGSERQTVFSPQLNKESIAINKSLSRLSTVLEALSVQQTKEDGTRSYVNFRDTTLTVLLQRYLSGASMTTFLACVHPSLQFYPETVSTLRYTQRLKKIRTSTTRSDANDISELRFSEHQTLLDELTRLRTQVKESRATSDMLAAAQRQRIAELERSLHEQRASNTRRGASAQREGGHVERAKDARRIAGWLLSRVLGDMPQLNVGYDDYFDGYFPESIQVIGYVSPMACLAPRAARDTRLAFLDVGDVAIGLSMVDAGIPPFVRLHKVTCHDVAMWEGHECDGDGHAVYVLAFFEVDERTMEPIEGGGAGRLACCGGYLSSEPLLPLATVLCMREDAPDAAKEAVLQRLVALQGEQEDALDRRAGHSREASTAMDEGVPVEALLDRSLVDRGGGADEASLTSDLSHEVARQARDTSNIMTPFRALSSSDESDDTSSNSTSSGSSAAALHSPAAAALEDVHVEAETAPIVPTAPPPPEAAAQRQRPAESPARAADAPEARTKLTSEEPPRPTPPGGARTDKEYPTGARTA
ncbi:kinesin [Strigomonas culicis]|uniref:Kinesin n=1 Tax=Strigomonas culicis TaxID=28005 RepID=S9TTN1_9TRYP|nr:kinesin [Strigomonas culicis]|eukprot:EPY19888.1 kinesin [Strigomonas culicis]